jgi:uncharacterized Rmd1/YagE family protein
MLLFMDCCAFCTASSYNIKPLFEAVKKKYKSTLYRDVIHIEIPFEDKEPIDIFYFPYGTTICWGASLDKAISFLGETRRFEHQPLEYLEKDTFTYSFGEKCRIVENEIILPDQDIMTKLAVSHGLAQSAKMGAFEEVISKAFQKTKDFPEDLAKYGKIPLSRKQIRKKMGELFIERSMINLHVDVLDTPEFFWDHSDLEPLYTTIANELDIKTRGQILNQRLDIVRELFEMLGNELNHQHSSRLEWIIIWLIICEVIISLLQVFNFL